MNRKIDNAGRISIPIEMRKELGLDIGDEVKIEVKNNQVIVTNPNTLDLKSYVEGRLKQAEETGIPEVITAYYDILQKINES